MTDSGFTDIGLCPNCHGPLSGGSCPSCAIVPGARIIRREIVLLAIIAVAAVPTYLLTRRAADLNRQRNAQIAAYWYRLGERQLKERKPEEAIASLREATANDHDNRGFSFALAQALGATNHEDEARLALLRLRESAPESPEINLQLARLSARSHDLPAAIRYYHDALYGLWTGEKVDEQRRQVRLELIHLLIDHKERAKAIAELLVLGTDAPRTADAQLELGELFMEVGDSANALQHFTQAAQFDGRNVGALAGAGEAAFQLADYETAGGYLSRAAELDKSATHIAQLLETTRLIETSDPLATRLSRDEQVRRLREALEQSAKRLQCSSDVPVGPINGRLQLDIETMLPKITWDNLREEPELRGAGAELVFKAEEMANQTCGEPAGLDEALLLAGRKHGVSER